MSHLAMAVLRSKQTHTSVKCGNGAWKVQQCKLHCDIGESLLLLLLLSICMADETNTLTHTQTLYTHSHSCMSRAVRVDEINQKGLKLKLKFEWVDFGQQFSTQSAG